MESSEEVDSSVIETLNNICIEHAYSEELALAEVRLAHYSMDSADSSSSSLNVSEEAIVEAEESVIEESIVETEEDDEQALEPEEEEEFAPEAQPDEDEEQTTVEPPKEVPELTLEQVAEKVKSRELKSLLEAAKESNLDTNIVHKRESRKSVDPFHGNGKSANDQHESGGGGKRTMRSQNPEFVAKHQKFLSKVSKLIDGVVIENDLPRKEKDGFPLPKTPKRKKENMDEESTGGSAVEEITKKRRKSFKTEMLPLNMKQPTNFVLHSACNVPFLGVWDCYSPDDKDSFCWRCHRDEVMVQCATCPRAFHFRCLKQPVHNPEKWACPECLGILQAESTKTRSPALRDMSLEHLCELLKYAANRMITCQGAEPFIHPVDVQNFPDYRDFIVQPMDLTTIQNNIRNNLYGSTVAFLADAKWILHNSIIYNSYQSKLTTVAKSIVKICKQEMSEIEVCSECYQNANTLKDSWFVEVCSKPHLLLWAKLKGFPYWPAKAMTTNSSGLVDCRFFGAHDRAWVPIKECFLYSRKDPNTTNKQKRNNIAECIKEVDVHISKMKEKYGEFFYAPFRTTYNPNAEMEQLLFMLPRYKPKIKLKSFMSSSKMIKLDDEDKIIRPKARSKSLSTSEIGDDDEKNSTKSSVVSEETETLTASSKTSLVSEDKLDKLQLKFSQEFDKFMEGYGTEDDEATSLTLNDEVRNKMIHYESDTDEESNSNKVISNNKENGTSELRKDDDDDDSGETPLSQLKIINDKVKSLTKKTNNDYTRKRSLPSSPSNADNVSKFPRRNSDMSIKSDSSRISGISDKISRVEEFSDTLEVAMGNASQDSAVSFSEILTPEKKIRSDFVSTVEKADLGNLKPVVQVSTGDLYNKNKELKISPQSKSVSMADRLMKKISGTEPTKDTEKVEAVKKQILDSLESTSSTNSTPNSNSNSTTDIQDDVTSSDNKENDKNTTEKVKEGGEVANVTEKPKEKQSTSEKSDVTSSSETSQNKIVSDGDKVCSSSNSNKENSEAANVSKSKVDDTPTQTKKTSDSENKLFKKSTTDSSTIKSTESKSMESSESSDEDSEVEDTVISAPPVPKKALVKLVNVSDIIAAKEKSPQKPPIIKRTVTENKSNSTTLPASTEIEAVDIKSEPISDDEEVAAINKKPVQQKVIIRPLDKERGDNRPFRVVDNLTRVIDSVAADYKAPIHAVNKKEMQLKTFTRIIHSPKQKARKSFPNSPHKMGTLTTQPFKKLIAEKRDLHPMPQKSIAPAMSVKVVSTLQSASSVVTNSSTSLNTIATSSKENMVYISSPGAPVMSNMALLPPNQPITLTTQNVGSPILAMVHHSLNPPGLIIQQTPGITNSTQTSQCPIITPVITSSTSLQTSTSTATNIIPITVSTSATASTVPPLAHATTVATNSASATATQVSTEPTTTSASASAQDGAALAENIAKAVGDLFCKPPPLLKPRPLGPLSTHFDEGIPSSAGPTTKLINSVSHRFADYFRGLLKETLHDLSTIGCAEAKVRALELEIESLKHKHAEEMLELRKNISSVLKDIQKSIIEDKAKIIDETRAACETERLRCIEETKYKQWCAYCFKEAQFYCCWNTSYCDYPCQQKHWNSHMNTCAQSRNESSTGNVANSSSDKTKQLTKTLPPNNKAVLKQTRMVLKPNKGNTMYLPLQRNISGQQTITLVESTPGNFEILGNHGPISLGGKLVNPKLKQANTYSASTSSSGSGTIAHKTIYVQQKSGPPIPKQIAENKT